MASSLTSNQLILNDVTLTSGSSGTILTDSDVNSTVRSITWHTLSGSDPHQFTYYPGGFTTTVSRTSVSSSSTTLSSISIGSYEVFFYSRGVSGTYLRIYLPSSGTYLYGIQASDLARLQSYVPSSATVQINPAISSSYASGGSAVVELTGGVGGDDSSTEYVWTYGWYYRIS